MDSLAIDSAAALHYPASHSEGLEKMNPTQEALQTAPSMLKGSIVVIVRDGESSIRTCLESLVGQTTHCEIVVVDGNSSDRTREIAREFPVKLVLAPKCDSYGISRNVGVQNSTGDVILFMDADDFCERNWAKGLLGCFESNPDIGIVNVGRDPIGLHGWFMTVLGFEYRDGKGLSQDRRRLTDWKSVTTKGTGWLKKAILEAGGFDGAMFFGTEDKDLAFRIFNLGYKVVHEPSASISVTPIGGAMNFLKDKYWRAGVGHGYFRRKHGVYRPSFSGIGSLVLMLLAVGLLRWNAWLALPALVLASFTVVSLTREGFYLRSLGAPLKSTIAFLFVKWLSRIAEFAGFVRGYLLFKRPPT